MMCNRLTINQRLGLIAVFLGLIAIFMPDPMNSKDVVVDIKSLANKMDDKSIQISVGELADNIIQSKADFILVDLCSEEQYNDYHIPLAENLKFKDLNPDNLPRNEKIILYSDDDFKTAQAWFLLKAKNYEGVYILKGGLSCWEDSILFPEISDAANAEEKANNEKLFEVSKFFGGQPQVANADSSVKTQKRSLPKPTASAAPIKRKKKKPRKEGC